MAWVVMVAGINGVGRVCGKLVKGLDEDKGRVLKYSSDSGIIICSREQRKGARHWGKIFCSVLDALGLKCLGTNQVETF